MSRQEVRDWMAVLDVWALVVVGAVFLGLVLEFIELVSALLFPKMLTFSESPKPMGIVGSFLVTFGVLGEFVVHFLHTRAANRLDETTDEEIARLNAESDKARSEIASANARAAEASALAESERLKRVEIEERRAPRRVSESQYNIIVSRLKTFGPIRVGIVVSAKDSAEPFDFGGSLGTALRAAGWDTAFATRVDHTIRLGAWIEMAKEADRLDRRAAPELIATLRFAGIAVDDQVFSPPGDGRFSESEDSQKALSAPIRINIGLHPVTARGL